MSKSGIRLSRRQALGVAVGGAAGAAGLSVLGAHLLGTKSSIASQAGASGAWTSPLDQPRALAAHLLRRAGFGYTASDLDQAASMKYSDLVDSVVNQKPDQMPVPAKLTAYASTVQAWYTHMATTSAQFPERMALFWHGHLTSDYRKAFNLPFVYQQNVLYRNQGTGDLRTLLTKTTYDPLMIRYLDLDQSSAKAPNENFSREVMELYTLGVGNYTEDDVREGARVFSGLRISIFDKNGNRVKPPKRGTGANALAQYYAQIDQLAADGATWQGQLVAAQHDQGSKTFLGQTGNFSPDDGVDIILSQAACAPFIANAALTYFATPSPSKDLVNSVAAQLRSSKYDIKTMMRSIFTSSDFTDPSNYRSLVRSPADYMVATMRALDGSSLVPQAIAAGQQMDQIIYDPPTVGGWPLNGAWLDSSSDLARVNFAAQAVSMLKSLPSPSDGFTTQLDGVVGPDLAAVYNASQSDEDRWYAILSSPEFQLK